MEDPTSFDLNNAIRCWRAGLSQSPQFRAEDLIELEAHLRDAAAALQIRGLTEEEAFLVAARRLGSPAGLEPEFAKINRGEVWLDRALWMLIGIQAWWLAGTLAGLGVDVAVIGGTAVFGQGMLSSGVSLFSMTLLTSINILLFAGAIVGCWWLARHKAERVRRLLEKAAQRPVPAGLAAAIFLVGFNSLTIWKWVLLGHQFSPQTLGVIAYSNSVASLILTLLQIVGLVVATLLLLRCRFRGVSQSYCLL